MNQNCFVSTLSYAMLYSLGNKYNSKKRTLAELCCRWNHDFSVLVTWYIVWNSPVAALLCDFTIWKQRYGLSLSLNLFFFSHSRQLCRAARGEKNHSSFFFFSSAQPRSVKAVCRALNKLIPYLWGSRTIYLSCNVIRGQVEKTWNQQVLSAADAHSFHHPTLFLFLLHPLVGSLQGDYAAVTGHNRK